jgi:hypothetical protein
MKISRYPLFAALFTASVAGTALSAHAHGLWIEPAKGGALGIHYGEVGNAEREKKDKLEAFGLPIAQDAQGNALAVTLGEDGFYAQAKGPITAAFAGGTIYGEGDKAVRYQSWLRYAPDLKSAAAPRADFPLDIVPVGGNKSTFKLFKGGKAHGGAWAEVTAPNGWTKYFEADSAGMLNIKTPWPGLYVIHVENEDETPGTQTGKPFAKSHQSVYLSVYKR